MIDKDSVMKTYGANLRNLISAKGISQGEVADLCGTHQTIISKICRSQTLPTLPIAMEIADLFETSVSEMLGEVEADKYETLVIKSAMRFGAGNLSSTRKNSKQWNFSTREASLMTRSITVTSRKN